MGRGRAKAKQTKVARELKYRNNSIDVGALRAELSGGGHHSTSSIPVEPDEPDGADGADGDDGDDDTDIEPTNGHYEVPVDDDDDWVPVRRRG